MLPTDEYEQLRKKITAELQGVKTTQPQSHEYQAFKKQYLPKHFTLYENACKFAENMNIAPSPADAKKYADAIETCHLNVTPNGVYSLALLVPALFILTGIFVSIVIPFMLGGVTSMFFFLLFIVIAAAVFFPLKNLPFSFAETWRMQASNQMVLCLFYITTYMRHTSNLENAIDFSADHIGPPLNIDLKKIIWNVQTEKYAGVTESLDHYLMQWRETNLEFVESMNLVQASLYESSQDRRLNSLEKAMTLMLEETYEKMLHYAQELKSPMTMLHMLGIILPILGLVILPLAVSFLEEVRWYHLMVIYNLVLPVGVYLLGRSVLAKRPSGYGNTDITDLNPLLKKLQKRIIPMPNGKDIEISPAMEAAVIAAFLCFIGSLPLIIHFIAIDPLFDIPIAGPFSLLQYVEYKGSIVGPYGLGASILSLFLTLASGLSFAHYYIARSRKIIVIRTQTKQLEQEFAGALFQLGNRLGDGIPAEIAFTKVADVMTGTKSGLFFQSVAVNIQKMGMSVEQAIFDDKRGAILNYPSPIIESSMKVLIESSKKGPLEAATSLITMSNYIKEMHRVEERLKDLMSDIISGMKSQINFLTPAIAGIVIGITSMITTILLQLQEKFAEFGDVGGASGGMGGFSQMLGIGIPTYYFQFIVGLYVVQITWILAYLVNGIENGNDPLNEAYEQGKGLRNGTILYVIISLAVIILFNLIAGSILSQV